MRPADLVLVGGRVHLGSTPPPNCPPEPSSLAVRRGRVVALGTTDAVRGLAGPRTEVVELRGRPVLPGFVDAHVHPVHGGLQLLRCDLTPATTPAECVGIVAEYVGGRGDSAQWVTGGGWSSALFPGGAPDRRQLDQLVPHRPVYLVDGDQHNAWVNSRALALAGIDAATPDPPRGRIGRRSDGAPSGCLHEAACDLVARLIPPPDPAQMLAALTAGRDTLHAVGITAWQDALVGGYLGTPDPLATYLDAAARGIVDVRATGALWWAPDRGIEQIDDLVQRRHRAAGAGLRMRHVKIMQDGICENGTAALGAPYDNAPPGCRHPSGIAALSPEELADAVTVLERNGFGVHFHAVGDRAVRDSLDAVAAARQRLGTAGRPPRHQIAHVQVVDPADHPRFAALGVTATIQPLWAAAVPQMTTLILPALGPRRAGWQYPFGSLHAAGARLAAGSDWPVSSPNPLCGIHVAVNRLPAVSSAAWLAAGRAWSPFLPAEAIGVATAIRAYTEGAAAVSGLGDLAGSLIPGRPADLVVLDRDPLRCLPDELEWIGVDLAIIGGQTRYASDGRRPAGRPRVTAG